MNNKELIEFLSGKTVNIQCGLFNLHSSSKEFGFLLKKNGENSLSVWRHTYEKHNFVGHVIIDQEVKITFFRNTVLINNLSGSIIKIIFKPNDT